jgi:hypothetical protein
MADLKFADYERKYIAKNKVDSMYEIEDEHNYITIYPYKYDSLGRILALGNGTFFQTGYRFKYDSLGLLFTLHTRSDISNTDTFSYHFYPNSLELCIFIHHDTIPFRQLFFDCTGREIKRLTTIELAPTYKIQYCSEFTYGPDGRIQLIKTSLIGSKAELYKWRNYTPFRTPYYIPYQEGTRKIYYSKGVIDSVITEEESYMGKVKTYYNQQGLRNKTVYNDSLMTTYNYIFRKP